VAKLSSAFNKLVRSIIDERARGCCELCGMPVESPQYHHRRPRGIGGTKRVETGQAQIALLLHQKCHTRVESNRLEAYESGWLVAQNADPGDVPVRLWDGWFVLDSLGARNPVTEINDVSQVDVVHSL
jgi:hypothetical protein